jgi:hypothetical protein
MHRLCISRIYHEFPQGSQYPWDQQIGTSTLDVLLVLGLVLDDQIFAFQPCLQHSVVDEMKGMPMTCPEKSPFLGTTSQP